MARKIEKNATMPYSYKKLIVFKVSVRLINADIKG